MLYCHDQVAKESGRRRWLPVWGALLCAALLMQSLLVQSHVHGSPWTAGIETADAGNHVASAPHAAIGGSGTLADTCFLCREAAAGGHYLPLPAETELASMPAAAMVAIAMLARWPLGPPPRAWFGRAPPQ